MVKINRVIGCVNNLLPEKVKSEAQTAQKTAVKNSSDVFGRSCECKFYYDDSGCVAFGDFPENYINIKKVFVEAKPETYSRFKRRNIPAEAAHWDTLQTFKPAYYIEHLFSHAKGQGTQAVKDVVLKSLNDTRTQGRVLIHADVIDGKTSPAGFYYKLGFRFVNNDNNKVLQNWIEKGGSKEKSPMLTGMMYLPSENIRHCLNY